MFFGGVDSKQFYVQVDETSGCYAVVAYDGFASETSERIKISHYNAQHVELAHSFYTVAEEKYKYVKYPDLAVDADRRVFLLSYGYNTRHSGGKELSLILSTLANGKLDGVELNNDENDFTDAQAFLRLNKKQKALQFLFLAKNKKKAKGTSWYIMQESRLLTTKTAKSFTQISLTYHR